MGVPDTYVSNSKNSGNFGVVGLRQVMSSECSDLTNILCRLGGTISSSTKDELGNLFAEVDMDILDVATDRAIATVKVGASKDIKGSAWDINNASVNKIGNHLTNLKQNEGGFESTPLIVEEVIVTANKSDRPLSGEIVTVGLSEPESVEVLSMAFDAIAGVAAIQGITKKFRARDGGIEGLSYLRTGKSNVTYGSTLQNGQPIPVTDSHHTRNIGSSKLAKNRRVESQGCVTSTYIPLNYGAEHFTYSTIAYNSELTPCALVTHTLVPVGSDSNDIPRPALSVNTEVSNNSALFTLKNLNMSWATVDQPIEK